MIADFDSYVLMSNEGDPGHRSPWRRSRVFAVFAISKKSGLTQELSDVTNRGRNHT